MILTNFTKICKSFNISGHLVLKKKISNTSACPKFHSFFFTCHVSLSLKQGMAFYLKRNLKDLYQRWFVPSLVETGHVVLEKKSKT